MQKSWMKKVVDQIPWMNIDARPAKLSLV